VVKDLSAKVGDAREAVLIQYLGWEDTLKKGMATHSSIPAWRISQAELGRLHSLGHKESDMTE